MCLFMCHVWIAWSVSIAMQTPVLVVNAATVPIVFQLPHLRIFWVAAILMIRRLKLIMLSFGVRAQFVKVVDCWFVALVEVFMAAVSFKLWFVYFVYVLLCVVCLSLHWCQSIRLLILIFNYHHGVIRSLLRLLAKRWLMNSVHAMFDRGLMSLYWVNLGACLFFYRDVWVVNTNEVSFCRELTLTAISQALFLGRQTWIHSYRYLKIVSFIMNFVERWHFIIFIKFSFECVVFLAELVFGWDSRIKTGLCLHSIFVAPWQPIIFRCLQPLQLLVLKRWKMALVASILVGSVEFI